MPFLDEIKIRVAPSQKTKVSLTARLRYKDRFGRIFEVPVGFTCDLASIPWWLRILPKVTSWSLSAGPGLFHDCGYRFYEIWKIPRLELDALYEDALVEVGVKPWRARVQRAGLRIGAWRAWRRWRATSPRIKGPRPPQRVPPPG